MMASIRKWRFYVYAVTRESEVVYIGKGSGNRLLVSIKAHGGDSGHEVARFKREADAFRFEAECIREHSPRLNKNTGGWGGKVRKQHTPPRVLKEFSEIETVGGRAYAARMLMRFRAAFEINERDPKTYAPDVSDALLSLDCRTLLETAAGNGVM